MTASVGTESVTAAIQVREVRISLTSGAGQWAVMGAKLPDPVEISAADQSGSPLAGIEIEFESTSGGHGSASPASVQTDSQGLARTAWTLGDIWGTQRLRARVRESSLEVLVEAESWSQDRKTLEDLYSATGGPGWENRENWLAEGVRIDRWYGVVADRTGLVLTLRLRGNNLTGSIPSGLGDLTNLRGLNLDGNELTGSIPSELGHLTNLVHLALGWNALTGPIPTELGNLTNLEYLVLAWNGRLTGPIPAELGNLTDLEDLDLAGNDLTGLIPGELGSLTNLEYLNLQANDLAGPIPPQLGNLANLRLLWMCDNGLTGPFPRWLRNLRNLRDLCLAGNDLSPGPIPRWLGDLVSLRDLVISSTNRTGPIPSELGNLTNLRFRLFLYDNDLTGPIPSELGNLTNLELLRLRGQRTDRPDPVGAGQPRRAIRALRARERQPCRPAASVPDEPRPIGGVLLRQYQPVRSERRLVRDVAEQYQHGKRQQQDMSVGMNRRNRPRARIPRAAATDHNNNPFTGVGT